MNMPPECVAKDSVDYFGSCCKYGEGMWTVFNKTKCEYTTVCDSHLDQVLDHGDTYIIYPAKDYSVHGGHDLPAGYGTIPRPRRESRLPNICDDCGSGPDCTDSGCPHRDED